METLDEREVHVWYVFPERLADPELLRRNERLLSPEERARLKRFSFEAGKREYLISRALLRTTLSRYAGIAAEAWEFGQNPHGRPELIGPEGHPRLHFNLSHCDGLIACVVARDREVGIDVENVERDVRALEVAGHSFSPTELRDLQAQPPERRMRRFFEYWTLKESYIKARGMGLSLPLGEFSFRVGDARPVRISFGPKLQDDPDAWQFQLSQPTPRHQMAVAIRKGSGPELSIVVREAAG